MNLLLHSTYHHFTRIFCLLLALHFLNFSIEYRDPNPDSVLENLVTNDIESLTEFFAEVVFQWVNTFEEHNEQDEDDCGVVDLSKFYCSNASIPLEQTPCLSIISRFHILNAREIFSLAIDVSSPPPKTLH